MAHKNTNRLFAERAAQLAMHVDASGSKAQRRSSVQYISSEDRHSREFSFEGTVTSTQFESERLATSSCRQNRNSFLRGGSEFKQFENSTQLK